ncbi:MAG TPA: hypothetical protein VFZ48_04610 [Candidatus Saccharimonadales bacterium]
MEGLVATALPHDPTLLMDLWAFSYEKKRTLDDVVNSTMLVLAALKEPKNKPLYMKPGYPLENGVRLDGKSAFFIPLKAAPRRKSPKRGEKKVWVEQRAIACLAHYCKVRGVTPATALRHGLVLLGAAEGDCLWVATPSGGIFKVNIERRKQNPLFN